MNSYVDSATGELRQVSTANPLPVEIAGGGGGGDASLTEQQAQTALLTAIEQNTANIEIKAESVNLNTDTLEAGISSLTDKFPTALSNGFFKTSIQEWQAGVILPQLPSTRGQRTSTDSLSVVQASDNVFKTTQSVTTITDISGSILLGGTAQTLKAADANGYGFLIQNLSNFDLWFSTVSTAVQDSPSIKLSPGGFYETPPNLKASGALSIIGSTTGQKFSARAWS